MQNKPNFNKYCSAFFAELKKSGDFNNDVQDKMLLMQLISDFEDSCHGKCLFARHDVIEILQSELHKNDGIKYRLHGYVIMPNHLHILLRTLTPNLHEIIRSFKSHTSYLINLKTGHVGPIWAMNYHDRYIRSNFHYLNVLKYIRNNPKKAGICAPVWISPSAGVVFHYTDGTIDEKHRIEADMKKGRYLPHCESEINCQLVTLRTEDSIPNELIRKWSRMIFEYRWKERQKKESL